MNDAVLFALYFVGAVVAVVGARWGFDALASWLIVRAMRRRVSHVFPRCSRCGLPESSVKVDEAICMCPWDGRAT